MNELWSPALAWLVWVSFFMHFMTWACKFFQVLKGTPHKLHMCLCTPPTGLSIKSKASCPCTLSTCCRMLPLSLKPALQT